MTGGERPYITCRELLDFLNLYLDGELPAGRRVEFDRHLAVCDPCRRYIREYRQTIAMGRAAFEPSDEPAEAPEELVRAILRVRKGSRAR
jgi:anti-sigma factor RsiW